MLNQNTFSRWHSIAFSIKGDSVSLILDCDTIVTKSLARGSSSTLNNRGLITIGHKLMVDEHYKVELQIFGRESGIKLTNWFRVMFFYWKLRTDLTKPTNCAIAIPVV